MSVLRTAMDKAARVRAAELSIYDALDAHSDLMFDARELEAILNHTLRGLNLDYPLRTRSKIAKQHACAAMGYSVPDAFRRTRPRFPGQNLDVLVQTADNVQIWNDQVEPVRRYALIRVDSGGLVTRVRVVSGMKLGALDRTGKLTSKYQAQSRGPVQDSVLVSARDTNRVRRLLSTAHRTARGKSQRISERLLPIRELFSHLRSLVGRELSEPGATRERIRGGLLHRLVQDALGLHGPRDTGQFPDIPSQLLEVKLQTARTIDLGLMLPDSVESLAENSPFRTCDVRYAVFFAHGDASRVVLDHVVLSTGADFFTYFRLFRGRVRNTKIQIPLPADFFVESE